jgi:hypothetical protein
MERLGQIRFCCRQSWGETEREPGRDGQQDRVEHYSMVEVQFEPATRIQQHHQKFGQPVRKQKAQRASA